jgi:hypothetical protein
VRESLLVCVGWGGGFWGGAPSITTTVSNRSRTTYVDARPLLKHCNQAGDDLQQGQDHRQMTG